MPLPFFYEELTELLKCVDTEEIVLVGDFNIDLLKKPDHIYCKY